VCVRACGRAGGRAGWVLVVVWAVWYVAWVELGGWQWLATLCGLTHARSKGGREDLALGLFKWVRVWEGLAVWLSTATTLTSPTQNMQCTCGRVVSPAHQPTLAAGLTHGRAINCRTPGLLILRCV
jgi:hypothetical protein